MNLTEILYQLEQPNVIVIVKNDYSEDRIMTIGADSRYEHEFTPIAILFKDELKKEIVKRLTNQHE